MLIKAIRPFTAFTGEMKVFNVDTIDELPDHIAQRYVDSGHAEPASKKKAGSKSKAADEAPADDDETADTEAPPA